MKLGIEVEGIHKGLPTLFCDSIEFKTQLEKLYRIAENNGITHLYISDNSNTLSYDMLRDINFSMITLDITRYLLSDRPSNLCVMLRDPSFVELSKLDLDEDMIKFERDKTVYVFACKDVITTNPCDFYGDTEIE